MGVVKLYALVQTYAIPVTEHADAYSACMSFIRLISTNLCSYLTICLFMMAFDSIFLWIFSKHRKIVSCHINFNFLIFFFFLILNDERVGMSGRNPLLFFKVRRQGSLVDVGRICISNSVHYVVRTNHE